MTKWEDLESEAVYAMFNMEDSLTNVDGAMERMINTQEQTFGQRWQSLLRNGQESLLPLGETLLDLAEVWLPKVSEGLDKATKWFADLSPTAQGVSVAIAGITAVALPLGAALGSIATPMILLGGATGIASAALAALVSPIGIAVTAVLGLAAGVGLMYNKWEEFRDLSPVLQGAIGLLFAPITAITGAIKGLEYAFSPAVESANLFGEGVSKATEEAVGGFLKLDEEATVALNQLAWSNATITDQIATDLKTKYADMGAQVLLSMQESHAAELNEMSTYFASNAALSSAEEQAILDRTKKHNDEKEKATKAGYDRITKILDTAAKENRSITANEQKEINMIQETQKKNAVKYMSESEAEQKAILEKLKTESSKITAEQAAEVVKNSKKQTDESIKEADKQYNDVVKWAIKQRDETGTMSKEEADKVIKDAKNKRDIAVKEAQGMHTDVVKEAKAQAKDHVKEIDWSTGEIKKKWQVMKDDVVSKSKDMFESSKKWFGDMKDDILKKGNDMQDSVSKSFSEIKDNMSKNINDAKDAVKKAIETMKGFFDFSWELPKLKMPRITTSGKFSLNPPSVPKFDIDWYAKGGIMTKPTMFGMNGNRAMVGGEAGAEAILPLNAKTLAGIGEGIAATMDNVIGKLDSLSTQMFTTTKEIDNILSSADQYMNPSNYKQGQTIETTNNYQPEITIVNQVPSISSADLARRTLQQQRTLAMEWGF